MTSFNGPAPRIPRIAFCAACDGEIDELGAAIGKRFCFRCEAPAQVGRNAKRQDPSSGLGPKDEHAVPNEDSGCAQPEHSQPKDPSND